MAKLFFRRGQLRGKTIPLDKGDVLIGRVSQCDISLRDEQLSRRHCRIQEREGIYYLEDLNSRNGCYVNGKRVEKARLYSGDILSFGTQEAVFESSDPKHFRPIPSLEGKVIAGKFEIQERIFAGPLFSWYLTWQKNLERFVLLEALNPPYCLYPPLRKQVLERARKANQIRHPALLEVIDVFSDEENVWIWLEKREGNFLHKVLKERGRIDYGEVLSLLESLLEVLEKLHEQNKVHGSLDPYGILVTSSGEARLVPPGCSPWTLGVRLQGGHGDDLLPYAPPEVWKGEKITPFSDIYSLGIVTYEMLTGRLPYPKGSRRALKKAHLEEPLPPLPLEVPESFSLLLESMTAKVPHFRPRVGEIRERLCQIPQSQRRRKKELPKRLPSREEKEYFEGKELVFFLLALLVLFFLSSYYMQVLLRFLEQ